MHLEHPTSGKAKTAADFTEAQLDVARKTRQIIESNLERHITIAELAKLLHVSPTQVKNCFRGVYGTPVFSHARRCRMEEAARLLAETDVTILEIAGKTGYENGSKFARAFRDVMGTAPAEYRRRIRWERENGVQETEPAAAAE